MHGDVRPEELPVLIRNALSAANPDVVFISGWSAAFDLVAILWAAESSVPIVLMSDSNYYDSRRYRVLEWIKSRIVSAATGAFVAGSDQADYVRSLGLKDPCIVYGYDAVDNDFFFAPPSGDRRGFLASARFVKKKNLGLLLDAYSLYLKQHSVLRSGLQPWGLTILGDGPLRRELEVKAMSLKLNVEFRGFLQYPDLPRQYATAGCFLHVSSVEQWGLVVNEAMAAGLPVLVSNRCGCAKDLVMDGFNGYALSPYDQNSWSSRMLEISMASGARREEMGRASLSLISRFSLERHAFAALSIAERVVSMPPKRLTGLTRLLIEVLSRMRMA